MSSRVLAIPQRGAKLSGSTMADKRTKWHADGSDPHRSKERMNDRLDTHLWVAAYLRRCSVATVPAYVRFRGDGTRGSVILKIVHPPTSVCRLLVEITDPDGRAAWMIAGSDASSETEADAYIERARKRDPDIWVIEIEDRLDRHPLDGRLVKPG